MLAGPLALALASLALPPADAPADPRPVPLEFSRLAPGASSRAPLPPELEALAGRSVRLVGHMVRMELPPRAAFYLAARPVEADESGGGTGDLPLDAVRVEVPWFAGEIPWLGGPLEVIGRLELGRREDDDGRVSWMRVVVERRPDATPLPSLSRDGVTPQQEGGRP